jgi:hypothetical protein
MTEPIGASENPPVIGDVPGQSRTPLEPHASFLRTIPVPVRFVLGYVIAVGAGPIIFAVHCAEGSSWGPLKTC